MCPASFSVFLAGVATGLGMAAIAIIVFPFLKSKAPGDR